MPRVSTTWRKHAIASWSNRWAPIRHNPEIPRRTPVPGSRKWTEQNEWWVPAHSCAGPEQTGHFQPILQRWSPSTTIATKNVWTTNAWKHDSNGASAWTQNAPRLELCCWLPSYAAGKLQNCPLPLAKSFLCKYPRPSLRRRENGAHYSIRWRPVHGGELAIPQLRFAELPGDPTNPSRFLTYMRSHSPAATQSQRKQWNVCPKANTFWFLCRSGPLFAGVDCGLDWGKVLRFPGAT